MVFVLRVLTKDICKLLKVSPQVVEIVVEMVIEPERQVDHIGLFGDDLGTTTEAGEEMPDIAVVTFDVMGVWLAGEQLIGRDQTPETVPVVGDEDFPLETDFVEQSLAACIITVTQNPGHGSPTQRVIGAPDPKLAAFF